MAKKTIDWNLEEYGFKIINWDFPEDDCPHCELILRINTGLVKINDEIYSFTGCPLPWDTGLSFLENLKKSANLTIKEIKEKLKEKQNPQT